MILDTSAMAQVATIDMCMRFMKCYSLDVISCMYMIVFPDDRGRYAYSQQPAMCRWNLRKLAEALAPNGLSEDMAKEGLKL